jgi:hypothetical protein
MERRKLSQKWQGMKFFTIFNKFLKNKNIFAKY